MSDQYKDLLLTDEEMERIYSTEGLDDLCLQIAKAELTKARPIIEAQARREERKRIRGELEDIRCAADGDYLSRIERLVQSLKSGQEQGGIDG